ncbi:WD repeat-containing protein 76-like isoform X2 [Daphnia pulicaria]|uniref:WD repeat-containing protein 76-like isoform X2 n=1 Tax=Daphnia pulicaria TaxID=35523 RepID=UPI001EEBED24|nr:WD repeat-containing protein 76-like isoform X2 [Daphnia pulicaria]
MSAYVTRRKQFSGDMEDFIDVKVGDRIEEKNIPLGSPEQNNRRVIVTRSKTNNLAASKQLPCFSYELNSAKRSGKPRRNAAVAKKRSHAEVDDEEVVKSQPAKKKNRGISEYELEVQKNIEERKKMFEMLKFGDAKQEFLDVLPNQRKRKVDEVKEDIDENDVPVKRGRPKSGESRPKKAKVEKKKSLPARTSSRVRKSTTFYGLQENESIASSPSDSSVSDSSMLDVSNESLLEMCNQPCKMKLRSRRNRDKVIRVTEGSTKDDLKSDDMFINEFDSNATGATMTLKNTYADQSSVDESSDFVRGIIPFLENGDSYERVSMPNDLQEFVQLMKTLQLSDDGISSLSSTGNRMITSMTWHPNPTRLILASANVSGTLGFWDIDHETDFRRSRAFDVHNSRVTGLSFDKFNPLRLFSTGHDGFIYNTSESSKNVFPTCHLQKDPSTLIVSRADGQVVTVDMRILPTIGEQRFKCFNGKIVGLSHHPLNENLIMAGSVNGEVGVFDLRNVQPNLSDIDGFTNPVLSFPLIGSRISGSFFSPLAGEYALITGKNVVEVYDLHEGVAKRLTNWNSTLSQRNTVLSRAIWHPLRDDVCIATGSDESIDMLSVPNCEILHSFEKRETSVSPIVNVFHPSASVLASGCSRIYVHRPPVSS